MAPWRATSDTAPTRLCRAATACAARTSRKGNGRDNAPIESLWGSLRGGRLYGDKFATRRQDMDEIIDWLTFYSRRRLHFTLGCVSPMRFEEN